jgi:hypothetical protein
MTGLHPASGAFSGSIEVESGNLAMLMGSPVASRSPVRRFASALL